MRTADASNNAELHSFVWSKHGCMVLVSVRFARAEPWCLALGHRGSLYLKQVYWMVHDCLPSIGSSHSMFKGKALLQLSVYIFSVQHFLSSPKRIPTLDFCTCEKCILLRPLGRNIDAESVIGFSIAPSDLSKACLEC